MTRFVAPFLAFMLVSIVVTGCSDDGGPVDVGPAPIAPSQNDSEYRVERLRQWSLIGNALTQGHDSLELQVFAPEGTNTVDAWLGDAPGFRLSRGEGNEFRYILDISDLGPGDYDLLLAADGSDTAFAVFEIHRTHPLYVLVTTDWDDPDTIDSALALQDELHEVFSGLRLTHFVGPYTFTDPEVSAERRQILVDWLKGHRDNYNDEIGLHIHPYCNFVETTDVTCRTQPSFIYDDGDETGYSVTNESYTQEEFTTLLERADELFTANGLEKPTSYRAGGWSADLSTLKALEATGYVADTSALNWARVEEWEGQANGLLYDWNKENWSAIGDTNQPYYPSESDILAATGVTLDILEVPDNGALVDYVSAEEMIEIFEANWDGSALASPTQVSIGFHPSNYNLTYHSRMRGALGHIHQFLASQDNGPVVYGTLSEMPLVWPKQ